MGWVQVDARRPPSSHPRCTGSSASAVNHHATKDNRLGSYIKSRNLERVYERCGPQMGIKSTDKMNV